MRDVNGHTPNDVYFLMCLVGMIAAAFMMAFVWRAQ
jgi:hypothetical protein